MVATAESVNATRMAMTLTRQEDSPRAASFDRSVFINCPFDAEHDPILQAIAFCIVYLGFSPRIAPEELGSTQSRLDRIFELITSSQYGIHDISRAKSTERGEFARMNMPFELGLDVASQKFGTPPLDKKSILVLEASKYDYQRSLSDLAGWDPEAHNNDYLVAIRIVRNWLTKKPGAQSAGTSLIAARYADFQEWHWDREKQLGASDEDIRAYPSIEFINGMRDWYATQQQT